MFPYSKKHHRSSPVSLSHDADCLTPHRSFALTTFASPLRYGSWFLNFSSSRPNDNCTGIKQCIPRCDSKFSPPNKLKCSNFFHDQAQTPEYPSGDGRYNDFDINLTHLSSIASTNAVTTVSDRMVYVMLLDGSC